jgi:hypothetical protein
MKLTHLSALGLLVLAFGCSEVITSYDSNGSLESASREITVINAPTSTHTYLQNYADTRLMAGYDAEILYSNAQLGYSNVYLHYGFNGWQNVQQTPLLIDDPTAAHMHATISIPEGTTSLEYAVYTILPDGTELWDNNGSFDYQVPVYPSLVKVTNNYNGTYKVRYLTTEYSANLHYGFDGWQDVDELTMNFDQNAFDATGVRAYSSDLQIAENQRLDFVFRTNEYVWDNNDGEDYFFTDQKAHVDVMTFASDFHPYAFNGLYVVGECNGYTYSMPVTITHSGAYVMAVFSRIPRGDWTFTMDQRSGDYHFYGTTTARVESYGRTLTLEVERRELQ